jgi:hypothetical protein
VSTKLGEDQFHHAQQDSQADPATKEALRYRTALYDGFMRLKELITKTAMMVDRRVIFCILL